VFLFAFDLIELDGEDMRRDPLAVRKATLVSLLRSAAWPGRRNNARTGLLGRLQT
jgi:ATP-dependent DNA ligase